MRIEDIQSEVNGGRKRVRARVHWEDCNRPISDVYFETENEVANDLVCNPHAFLVACILPAMRNRERRILINEEICPELRNGLTTAMHLIRHWYDPDRPIVTIESRLWTRHRLHPASGRTAFFFSGGIDSLATLRANRLNFPLTHPGSIKDGLWIYGLEIDNPQVFQDILQGLLALAREAEIEVIPVYTNVRLLEDDWAFWTDEFEAAVLSSMAHAFAGRLSAAMIASSFDIPYVHPHGSHPLLDPNYSSYDLRILHDGITLSRLEKTRLVASWEPALQSLRVCNKNEAYRRGIVNCGKCEKCLRTLVSLLVLGKLDQASSFAHKEISEELIRCAVRLNDTTFPFWRELVIELERLGYQQLVRAVEYLMCEYSGETGWKGAIKRFDRRILGGKLVRLKRLATEVPGSEE